MIKSVANIVVARMRLRNLTVVAWARMNRFKPDTVYKTIHGLRGRTCRGESVRIRQFLQRDGFWPEEEGSERGRD